MKKWGKIIWSCIFQSSIFSAPGSAWYELAAGRSDVSGWASI